MKRKQKQQREGRKPTLIGVANRMINKGLLESEADITVPGKIRRVNDVQIPAVYYNKTVAERNRERDSILERFQRVIEYQPYMKQHFQFE